MNTSPNLNLNLPELTDTADITPITANFSTIDTFAGNVYVKTEVYSKTEVDTFLTSKADSATTYTKVEVDTLLGAKANDNAVVKLTGDQNINGLKTFIQGNTYFKNNSVTKGTVPPSGRGTYLRLKDANGASTAEIYQWFSTNGSSYLNLVNTDTRNGSTPAPTLNVVVNADGTGAITATGIRDYASGNTTDVATIKTLDQYAPMVRTTGNQDISGEKTFNMSSAQPVLKTKRDVAYPPSQAYGMHIIAGYFGTKQIGRLQYSIQTNGVTYIDAVVLNSDGTEKTVRLATGDVIA